MTPQAKEQSRMTKSRFREILLDEGMPEIIIDDLWGTRPDLELNEQALRLIARRTILSFIYDYLHEGGYLNASQPKRSLN